MEQLNGFAFAPLRFDADGSLTSLDTWSELKQQALAATDVVLIAHGFRNDEADARQLYGNFLQSAGDNFRNVDVSGRTFVVGGVFWPSKSFRESFGGEVQSIDDEAPVLQQLVQLRAELNDRQREKLDRATALLPTLEGNAAAQDEFVDLVLSVLGHAELGAGEGLEHIRSQPGSELLDKLSFPVILPTRHDEDEGGALGIRSFAGSVFGRVGQLLNLTTWYLMKERSGIAGANGVQRCVRELKALARPPRVHLVGHSLGGRLMASCCKLLGRSPVCQVESLTLLDAAFSHFGFSADNRLGQPGFFRDVIAAKVVKGPMIATFSFQDTVVGLVYAVASRLAGDNVKAVGDREDPFGGIGRNGAVNLPEAAEEKLHAPGTPYRFQSGMLYSLDGSGGLIRDHGDVTNPFVTYAFASAVAQTA